MNVRTALIIMAVSGAFCISPLLVQGYDRPAPPESYNNTFQDRPAPGIYSRHGQPPQKGKKKCVKKQKKWYTKWRS